MKAVRFVNPEGETRIGALGEDGTITDAGAAGPQGFVPTTLAWEALQQADGPTHSADEVKLLHPVVPNKLIGIGLNYRSHAAESQLDIPSVPVIFAKFSSSLVGPGAEIVIPREETRPDYEGELAVVIGQGVYRADQAEARAAVGGIAAINDVSGRRAQLETPLRQFTLGKSFDTFSPLGPCIASADGVDLADIDLRTTVSGEVMQDANTSRPDLLGRGADRVHLGRRDARARRRDRDRDAERRRRLALAQALPARGRHGRDLRRGRRHALEPSPQRALITRLRSARFPLAAVIGCRAT